MSAEAFARNSLRNKASFGLMSVLVLIAAAEAAARPNIRSAFFAEYPNAVGTAIDTVPSHATHCGVCHYDFNGGGARNPFGVRLGQVIGGYPNTEAGRRDAIRSIQNEDSDGDGHATLVEVTDTINFGNTPTFPGLTPANVSNVSNVSVAEIQGYLVPLASADTTPPTVSVVSPNGGGSYAGNASLLVQWSATDASGVASIDLYLSDDNGASYRPLALGLPNVSSRTVYVPNRPTIVGLVRVRATDNAGNAAFDDSDAAFSVTASPVGIAPTTLRDFDLTGSQPFEAGTLNDPSYCATCHGNYDPASEPYFNWQGSMMAHASIDPLFEACMAVANQDAPDSGDLCLRCHTPNGWVRGRSVPTDGSQMLSGDKVGVSCDMCHGLVDPFYEAGNPVEDQAILAALSSPPDTFGNGTFVLDPTGVRRGPFADATLGHPILVSPFHREAALCGTCHDVSNSAFEKDVNGDYPPNAFDTPPTDLSSQKLMPIERTYSEWFNSEYNTPTGVYAPQFGGNKLYVASCQDCHLRDITGFGCNDPEAPERPDLPLHDMTGGSTWLPGVLATLYPGQVNTPAVQAGILRARYMLQNAATLDAVQEDNSLKVTVTNESGHKLPTGYPEGRRVWINVRVYDASQVLLAESGAYDSNTGVLTHDAQAKVYEAEPGLDDDTAGLVGVAPGPSFHFVLNNKIYKDNRIPPRGFTNAGFAAFGGAPVGHVYADGQHWDDTYYSIPPGAASAEITLYYQSTSKEFIEFLRDANTTNSAGQFMYDAWNDNGKSPPESLATLSVPVTFIPAPGDLDADGALSQTDVDIFVNVLLGIDGDPLHVDRTDLNDDGSANGADAQHFVDAFFATLSRAPGAALNRVAEERPAVLDGA